MRPSLLAWLFPAFRRFPASSGGGVLPVVGVPLPFMSYGGTALTTLGIAIGMIMSVGRQRRLMKS